MSFLDVLMALFVVLFAIFIRPLKSGEQGFDRDTTATFRGLAMLGIIIHHIHNKLGYNSQVLLPMGYLATGLFFFISGYGNTLSINKQDSVKVNWLYNKLLKIYVPFFAAYWIYYIILITFYSDLCPTIKETLIDLLTVSLPNEVNWFLKVILCCFLTHWIVRKLFENVLVQNIVIVFVTIVSIVFMREMGMPSYWYNSVICYPIGCFFAKPIIFKKILAYFKDKKIISFIGFSVLFVMTMVLSKKIWPILFVCPVMLSLACYYFTFAFTVKTKVLAWVGKHSLEFYIFHLVCWQAFAYFIDVNKYCYAAFVIAGSFVLVYVYLLMKKYVLANRVGIFL